MGLQQNIKARRIVQAERFSSGLLLLLVRARGNRDFHLTMMRRKFVLKLDDQFFSTSRACDAPPFGGDAMARAGGLA